MSENETPIEGEIVTTPQPAQYGLSLGSLPMASPAEIVQRATEVAKVLTKVIKDQHLSRNIQGREYVYVTGWSTLGAMLGIMARETPGGTYAREDGSYVGSVDLVRVSDGMVIGGGTAVVGMDEVDSKGNRTWGSRPEYARRSMAVTRAAGKAYRLTLAWIMALAGFEGTPAEEMDGLNLGHEEEYSKPKPTQPPTTRATVPPSGAQGREAVSTDADTVKPRYSARELHEAIMGSINKRADNAPEALVAVSTDKARKLAQQWRNVMGGTGMLPDASRYAIVTYLIDREPQDDKGAPSFKGLSVVEHTVLEAWLSNAPQARAEAREVWAWLNPEGGPQLSDGEAARDNYPA